MEESQPQCKRKNGIERLLEESLFCLFGKEGAEQKIEEKISEFGGLIGRNAAIWLLCEENGISSQERLPIECALRSRSIFSLTAKADRIFPLQEFPGGNLCSLRIHISDETGQGTLVLWNEQAKDAQRKVLAGDMLLCTGAYAFAGEIHISKKGALEVEKKAKVISEPSALSEGVWNIEGTISSWGKEAAYTDRTTGKQKPYVPFTFSMKGKKFRAVAWHIPENAGSLEGMRVVLENAVFKNSEIHLNANSRILPASQNQQSKKAGVFRGIEFEGEEVHMLIGEEKLKARLGEALRLFGLEAALQGKDGEIAKLLLSIKADFLKGKEACYFMKGSEKVERLLFKEDAESQD